CGPRWTGRPPNRRRRSGRAFCRDRSLVHDVVEPAEGDDVGPHDQDALAIAFDAGHLRGRDVVLPTGLRVAQVVQVDVFQFEEQLVDALERAEADVAAPQVDHHLFAEHFLDHGARCFYVDGRPRGRAGVSTPRYGLPGG